MYCTRFNLINSNVSWNGFLQHHYYKYLLLIWQEEAFFLEGRSECFVNLAADSFFFLLQNNQELYFKPGILWIPEADLESNYD